MIYELLYASRRRHARYWRDWSSDMCSSDLYQVLVSNIKQSKKLREAGEEQELDGLLAFKGKASEILAFEEDPDFEERVAPLRSGTGEARIRGVELLDERKRPAQAVAFGSTVTVRVYLEYLEAVKESDLIIALHEKAEPEQAEQERG